MGSEVVSEAAGAFFLWGPVCLSLCFSLFLCLTLCFSLLLWCVCPLCLSPFQSVFYSGSLYLCPPVPLLSLPSSGTALAWPRPTALFLFPLQLYQQRVATAAGDPLASQRTWWEGEVFTLALGGPAGVPHSRQLSRAVNSAKTEALAFICRLSGLPRYPALGV